MLIVLEARKLSELTFREEVTLRTTLEAVYAKQYQCGYCLNQFKNRPNGEELLEATKKQKACQSPSDKPLHSVRDRVGELRFRRCPGNFVSSWGMALITAHDAWERGIPYCAGGFINQPSKVLQAFEIIELWKAERERARNESEAKRRNRDR